MMGYMHILDFEFYFFEYFSLGTIRNLFLASSKFQLFLPQTAIMWLVVHPWKGLRKLNCTDPLGVLHDVTGSRNSRWRTPDRNIN